MFRALGNSRVVAAAATTTTTVRGSALAGSALPFARTSSVWTSTCRMSKAGWCSCTSVLCKDVYKNDRKESRRLTFEERAERRGGRSREQKETREQLMQEAQTMVSEDLPEELESVFMRTFEKANISAMKVLNMAKCLELLEAEMAGGHTVLLTKVAQVVKTSNTTIEIVPNSTSFAAAILQRVSRFDSTLQVSKEGTKIKVVMSPITTSRRDKTAAELNGLIGVFRERVKQCRTNAVKVLQNAGLEEGVQQELSAMIDSTVKSFEEEKVQELELLAEEVMSMGIDESDVPLS